MSRVKITKNLQVKEHGIGNLISQTKNGRKVTAIPLV